MEDQDAHEIREPRPATSNDLLTLCGYLNEAGAKYIVVGGWAMIQLGYGRTTQDVDLLVDPSPEKL